MIDDPNLPFSARPHGIVRWGISGIVAAGFVAIVYVIVAEASLSVGSWLFTLIFGTLVVLGIYAVLSLIFENKMFYHDRIEHTTLPGRVKQWAYTEIREVLWASDGSHLLIKFGDSQSLKITKLEDPERMVYKILDMKGVI